MLFIISSALISSVVEKGFTLTAQIQPKTIPADNKLKKYLQNSRVTFGWKNSYLSEFGSSNPKNITAVYNSLNTKKNKEDFSIMMYPGEFNLRMHRINLYAENLKLPYKSTLDTLFEVEVSLNLYMQGYLVDQDTFKFTIDSLYNNQHPDAKINNPLTPLANLKISKNESMGFQLEKLE